MKEVLYNENIKAKEVRIIDNGQDLGIMSLNKAIAIAQEKNLDVVVVSAKTDIFVCKLLDYKKYIYEIKKKEKQQKKMCKVIEIKTIQLRYCISNHDLNTKLNHTKEFLNEGNKVIFVMKFRKKEVDHIPKGKILLEKIIQDLNVIIDKPLLVTTKQISVTVRK